MKSVQCACRSDGNNKKKHCKSEQSTLSKNERKNPLKTFFTPKTVSHSARQAVALIFNLVFFCVSFTSMNKTKLVHQSTIWCMCVRACAYALFAIVSRIIRKYRHVSISALWKCVPNSLILSHTRTVLSHILAYRRVKIQFYINMLLSPCTKTVRRKESINALINSNTHISLVWWARHFSWFLLCFLLFFAVTKECGCFRCHFRTI